MSVKLYRKYAYYNVRSGKMSAPFGLCWDHFREHQYATPTIETALVQIDQAYPNCSVCLGPPKKLPLSSPEAVEEARKWFRFSQETKELPEAEEQKDDVAARDWRSEKWAN
jgi:hypothetical protein